LAEQQIETKTLAFAFDRDRLALLHVQPHNPAVLALAEKRRMMLPEQERVRLSRIPIDPAITAAILAAATSSEAFERGKQRLRQLQSDLSDKRAMLTADIVTFQKCFVPQSPGELIKATLAAQLQRRMDGSDVSQAVQPQVLCALDAAMNVKGGSRRASRHPDGPGAGRTYPQSHFNRSAALPVAPSVKPWQTKKLGTV
jgi:hypothetical protein